MEVRHEARQVLNSLGRKLGGLRLMLSATAFVLAASAACAGPKIGHINIFAHMQSRISIEITPSDSSCTSLPQRISRDVEWNNFTYIQFRRTDSSHCDGNQGEFTMRIFMEFPSEPRMILDYVIRYSSKGKISETRCTNVAIIEGESRPCQRVTFKFDGEIDYHNDWGTLPTYSMAIFGGRNTNFPGGWRPGQPPQTGF